LALPANTAMNRVHFMVSIEGRRPDGLAQSSRGGEVRVPAKGPVRDPHPGSREKAAVRRRSGSLVTGGISAAYVTPL
jgi:hypothetical protein